MRPGERALDRDPVVLAAVATAAGAAIWVAVFPRAGTDLSAHIARAGWARDYPGAAYLFSWYGGSYPASYSLLTPYLLAAVGVHPAMAVAAVVSAALLALLMQRHNVPRPRAAALWSAAALCTELTAGRAAFTLGLAPALGCVAIAGAARPRRWLRLAAAGGLAALSSLLSPVTGLLLGVPAAGYLLAPPLDRPAPDPGRPRPDNGGDAAGAWKAAACRRLEGVVVGVGAAVPLGAAALFSDGGVQPIDAGNTVPSLLAVVLVLLLVPRRWRTARAGAVVYGIGVIAVWAVPTTIGSNVERLASLLAGPVLAGMAEPSAVFAARGAGHAKALWWRCPLPGTGPPGRRVPGTRLLGKGLLAAGLAAAAGWQVSQPALDLVHGNGPPVVPETAALVRELGVLHAGTARVEAVPQYGHWESQQLASAVPLARGWERQLDTVRNPVFYHGVLTPQEYYAWLRANAVRYVAISSAAPDFAAVAEASIVRAGEAWLVPVWRNSSWRLYRVAGAQPLASPPAAVIGSTPAAVTVRMGRAGSTVIRVRWSPLLRGTGGATVIRAGTWTRVTMPRAGDCVISAPY